MTGVTFAVADATRETSVNNTRLIGLATEDPQSELLEESLKERPFDAFFAATLAHQEPWMFGEDVNHYEGFVSGVTSMLSDDPVGRRPRWRGVSDVLALEDSSLAKHNSDRVTLLARKYVEKERFADEHRARLEIVTERVRRMLPAVAPKDFETLERVLELVKEARQVDADIRAALGIGKKNG